MKPARLLVAFLLLSGVCSVEGAEPAAIRWNELATRIVGHEVTVLMEGGVRVVGEALAVRDQSLLVNLKKSSDRSRYAQGEVSLPRGAITEVRVLKQGWKGSRIVGTVLGSLVGFVAGMAVGESIDSSSGAAENTALVAIWGAGTVGGYFIGRSVERNWEPLRIAPSPAQPGATAAREGSSGMNPGAEATRQE